jgi:hypothetical protein
MLCTRRLAAAAVPLVALVALVMALATPAPAAAQASSFEYTEVTTFEASGLLGFLLARHSGGEEQGGVHILGSRMRQDSGESSVIFDGEAREWIILDHDIRTYMRFTMADMREAGMQAMEALRDSRDEVEAARAEAQEELAEMEEAMAEARREMEITVRHIPMNQRERINGYDAERHQIVVEMAEAEGIQGAEEVDEGSLVVLLELWMSEELAQQNPLYAQGADSPIYQAFMEDPDYRAMAEEMSEFFGTAGQPDDLAAFALIDARVGAAVAEALESLAEVEGMAVRTTMVVAVLPATVELDTEQLIAWEPSTMGDQLRGQASQAAQDAARDAARDAIRGMTRGILGRRGGDEEQVAEQDLTIHPLVRVTTELSDVRTGGTPTEDMFRIPEGYTEFDLAALMAAPPGA